jgi:hypothetical protein
VLDAVRNADIQDISQWMMGCSLVQNEDVGLEVFNSLKRLGVHVCFVGFPCGDHHVIRMHAERAIRMATGLDFSHVRTTLQSQYVGSSGFGGAGSGAFSVAKHHATLDTLLTACQHEVMHVMI